MRIFNARVLAVVVIALTTICALAATANARNVYWTDYDSGQLMRTDVDGGTPEFVVNAGLNANGVAVDRATGRIYWVARGVNEIGSVSPDGSDPQFLNLGSAPISQPVGVAIDARAQRIYWANNGNNTIGWASLDGSGTGGQLDTGTATIDSPQGVALDSISGRLFWVNVNGTVSAAGWTSLDGSGVGGDLGGPTNIIPIGAAFSPDLNQIFWSGYGTEGVEGIDVGSGVSSPLSTAPLSIGSAGGVGLDAATGRLYIAGYDNDAIYAINADGTGGGTLIANTSSPWGSPAVDGAGALAAATATVAAPAGGVGTGTLRLTNSGDYPIELYDRTLSSPMFSSGAGCPDRLPVGGVCDLTISHTGTGGDVQATLTIATDAGSFQFNVTGTLAVPLATAPLLSRVKAATRCAKSTSAGSLSVSFESATATAVTAKLRRSSRPTRWVPRRCPKLFGGGSGSGTKLSGLERRKNFAAASGKQAYTLKQFFKVKNLAPGRYRLALSYKNAAGSTVTKSTWFWVLR